MNDAKANYPFLHSSFGQCVSVLEIIDFYVLDVVAILLEDLAGRVLGRMSSWGPDDGRTGRLFKVSVHATHGRRDTYSANRRHVDMLNALLRLDLRVDPRCRGRRSCCSVKRLRPLRLGRRGAICAFARDGAACATGLGLPARGRPRATLAAVEARSRRAVGFGRVEARTWTRALRHGGGTSKMRLGWWRSARLRTQKYM